MGETHAGEPVMGYQTALHEQTAALPLYLVAEQESVRPQYLYARVDTASIVDSYRFSMPAVMSSGAGIVGGALGGAIAEAMIRAEAISAARDGWQWANHGTCRLDVRSAMEPSLLAALAESGLPSPTQHVLLEDTGLATHFDP